MAANRTNTDYSDALRRTLSEQLREWRWPLAVHQGTGRELEALLDEAADTIESLQADLRAALAYVPHEYDQLGMHDPNCPWCEVEERLGR